jgi:hypothetical protein
MSNNHLSRVVNFRAFGKGKEPTTPDLQHAVTNSGPETKNIGATITGKDNSFKKPKLLIIISSTSRILPYYSLKSCFSMDSIN